jgi:hypothetical protein
MEKMADEEANSPTPPEGDGKPATGGKQSLIDLLDQLIKSEEPGDNGNGAANAGGQ